VGGGLEPPRPVALATIQNICGGMKSGGWGVGVSSGSGGGQSGCGKVLNGNVYNFVATSDGDSDPARMCLGMSARIENDKGITNTACGGSGGGQISGIGVENTAGANCLSVQKQQHRYHHHSQQQQQLQQHQQLKLPLPTEHEQEHFCRPSELPSIPDSYSGMPI